jgi:hypothetical protein
MRLFLGFFEGALTYLTPKLSLAYAQGQKGQGPLKNPLKCPIMCMAHEKKIISHTFRINSYYLQQHYTLRLFLFQLHIYLWANFYTKVTHKR